MLYQAVTEMIIGAFYRVYNSLGFGFLEKVYENAMVLELAEVGFLIGQQQSITVYYKGMVVGDYVADITVNNKIIIEMKACDCLREEHTAQLMNYLKATDMEVGLLLNFGRKPEFRRVVFSNGSLADSPR
jgi:GxxExxY protein